MYSAPFTSTWSLGLLWTCSLLFFTLVAQMGLPTAVAFTTSTTTTDLPSILDRVSHSHGGHSHHHKCYVCLPPDQNSTEAQDIIKLFHQEKEKTIESCEHFTHSHNRKAFEFKCPVGFPGCVLKIQGTNVSRSCGRFNFNDCKTANSKELCFCNGTLCNGDRSSINIRPIVPMERETSEERTKAQDEKDEAESRKFWEKGETDDEDLLEMADDNGMSGDGPYPPGVIDAYTTTPKPTLVPNIRGEISVYKTTTATPLSGTSRSCFSSLTTCSLLLLLFSISFYFCGD